MLQAFVRNVGTCVSMLREKSKWRPHKGESTDARRRGGLTRISYEVSIMEMERRGWLIWL